MKGIAIVDGIPCESDERTVKVQFPSYSEIVSDEAVQTKTDAEWANTLTDCTPDPNNRRRERGFWVRLNTAGAGTYQFTAIVTGPWVGPGQGTTINLGARPADNPAAPAPNAPGATYTVASFHAHTPTAYLPNGTRDPRRVGPTPDNGEADRGQDVTGIVYDYIESPAGSGRIPMGHPEGSPAQLYHSGPERRIKP